MFVKNLVVFSALFGLMGCTLINPFKHQSDLKRSVMGKNKENTIGLILADTYCECKHLNDREPNDDAKNEFVKDVQALTKEERYIFDQHLAEKNVKWVWEDLPRNPKKSNLGTKSKNGDPKNSNDAKGDSNSKKGQSKNDKGGSNSKKSNNDEDDKSDGSNSNSKKTPNGNSGSIMPYNGLALLCVFIYFI